ncbi:enoyl-CoA hydratase/isomerase family protein [Tenacibaculum finnmarkense]|uniref:enoyl-CoA hydratase/isomerase family protein n=1 Tax=Tenacibaculum finnmarkense TaxID=2781243 RepID=UPI001E5C52EE|nr:enoyl-CoA hydratase/isomerase family protein [Tenacibaculum finnmarkense]MCD8412564.1 enoyl-CoA hydratase/isomerase family protein [Tenacibaculum finnmarkense genomovar ulcerans]MCG8206383.1 enoyl-CoA hydratase/isomerase family protein [Tenacibaculum finnmarkense genomovar finnmarkense]MCG8722427.1 enoyl-CoA hydratase/isomerase family protein [Tenacibaculum finnmarkense]MCG8740660.1 enoyl-CoA hydratase/isomerase family protein [Tenacibaculum finnmarkense]MCG8764096.1 enoyl-CoA hydratase/iso
MTTTRENGSLYTYIDKKIATIEFGHPASNSFPSELLTRLANEFNSLSNNEDVAIIILKSEGNKAFCAGASFDELIAIENIEQGKQFFSGFANVINAMRCCSKLIIGRVQGKTIGGGVGLVSACDYVFATENASIKLSELSIGIGPFVIAPAVSRKINLSGLAELTLDATSWKNAYWAKEKGLYARVFESVDDLDKEVEIFTEKLASYNYEALSEMKKTLWIGTEHWQKLLLENAEISGKLVLSEATKKALSKFKK